MKNIKQLNILQKVFLPFTIAAAFFTTGVYAHGSCNVELEAGFNINKHSIEFFSDNNKKPLYKIENDKRLIVGGENIPLDAHQQGLVKQYSTSIKAMVPKVRNISIEGVNLAIDGLNVAFNGLLGEGNPVGTGLTKDLSSLRDEAANRFTLENGFTIGEDGLETDELLGEEFTQRIESTIENAMMRSMGSIMMAVGQKMLSSDGESDNFEDRMESFSENIENEMKMSADRIEQKANKLCSAVLEIELLEEKLKASIAPLADINVISARFDKQIKEYSDKRAM